MTTLFRVCFRHKGSKSPKESSCILRFFVIVGFLSDRKTVPGFSYRERRMSDDPVEILHLTWAAVLSTAATAGDEPSSCRVDRGEMDGVGWNEPFWDASLKGNRFGRPPV